MRLRRLIGRLLAAIGKLDIVDPTYYPWADPRLDELAEQARLGKETNETP